MKVIISGGRKFNDYTLLFETINKFIINGLNITEIVSGGAKGADQLGERFANESGIKIKQFLPNYKDHVPRVAPLIRNEGMALYADMCIAFWDGESKGTGHMISMAQRHNLILKVIRY
jgi:hypothetical protein